MFVVVGIQRCQLWFGTTSINIFNAVQETTKREIKQEVKPFLTSVEIPKVCY